ncbi:hypothetical protein C7974DRAFT_37100 [Boeremia exigua]|uniref:uncharacterized protein n=1 Tax=Boeremia exigua TaxID=749465 RepID=UPI001E8E6ED9|nr:uncharacterized protein C7974DRAFT_37100 [Boeremia exigua]KAH6618784.1 hypothetical protein C7974DRAFT_37100 [Boeremia exigua]
MAVLHVYSVGDTALTVTCASAPLTNLHSSCFHLHHSTHLVSALNKYQTPFSHDRMTLPLRLMNHIKRITARLQLQTIRRPFTTGLVAAAATGWSVAMVNHGFGFGLAGVRRGSRAAAWQSSKGSVDRGSAFSISQSAGAGGSGSLILYGVPTAGAALITIYSGYRMRTRTTIRRLWYRSRIGSQRLRTQSNAKQESAGC